MKFLAEVSEERAVFDDLEYECQAVVGVPSSEIRRILMHLKSFGLIGKPLFFFAFAD